MVMSNVTWSKKQAENILQPLDGIRFELNEGTPRSGKTTSDCVKMALFYLQTRDPSHLILAYSQEQAYRLMVDGEGFGLVHTLGPLCEVKHDQHGDHLLITQPDYDNRKIKVYYKGGGKSNAVGAITGMSLGSVVYLEYNLLHPEVITESFRRTTLAIDRYHLAEQNPPAPNHPNLKLYGQFERSGQFIFRHWTPQDNPRATQERLDEIYSQVKDNAYLLDRDWFGNRVLPQGAFYSAMQVTGDRPAHCFPNVPESLTYVETYFTADGGTTDATSVSCNQVFRLGGRFYNFRVASYYHSNADKVDQKAFSDYAKDIKQFMQDIATIDPRINNYNFFAVDPACKPLRLELEKLGIARVESADNNRRDKAKGASGSMSLVLRGIEYGQISISRRRFALIDHIPEALGKYGHADFMGEASMYVADPKSGLPVDKYNHSMDEFRYSNNYFYKNYLAKEHPSHGID